MVENRLAEALKSKGIKQKEFAAMAGIRPQYISAICTGKVTLSLKQLARFAEMLKLPVHELIKTHNDAGVFYCPHCGMPIRATKEDFGANEEEEV